MLFFFSTFPFFSSTFLNFRHFQSTFILFHSFYFFFNCEIPTTMSGMIIYTMQQEFILWKRWAWYEIPCYRDVTDGKVWCFIRSNDKMLWRYVGYTSKYRKVMTKCGKSWQNVRWQIKDEQWLCNMILTSWPWKINSCNVRNDNKHSL